MSYPSSSQILGKIIQSSDGTYTETYTISASDPAGAYKHRIGTGLTPAQPANWQNLPKGAFPIDPPAALLGFASSNAPDGHLTALATYNWGLTYRTDWGETQLGAIYTTTLTGSNNTVTFSLPALGGTSDNPVRAIEIYRTLANPGASPPYLFVAQITDLRRTAWTDIWSDLEINGGDQPPATNGSGLTGVVSLSGGGVTWVEVKKGAETVSGQFSVDYSLSLTGGIITHAPADVGKTVTITYTAATLASAPVVNDLITALKDTQTILGTGPQGAFTDVTGRFADYDTYLNPLRTKLTADSYDSHIVSGHINLSSETGAQPTVAKTASGPFAGANVGAPGFEGAFGHSDRAGAIHIPLTGAVNWSAGDAICEVTLGTAYGGYFFAWADGQSSLGEPPYVDCYVQLWEGSPGPTGHGFTIRAKNAGSTSQSFQIWYKTWS